MKFLKLALTCLVLFYALFLRNEAYAATITSSATGNWSSATTWVISLTRPGTVTSTLGSRTVTGSALASFTSTLSVGSQVLNTSNVVIGTVESIQTATSLTLVANAAVAVSNAGWNSRGVGPGDAVTIAVGHTITVDGNYTCASLAFTAASTNNVLTLGSTNTLTVTGLLSMPNPSLNKSSVVNVNNGTLTCGSLTTSGSSATRFTNINIVNGTLDVNGNYTSASIAGTIIAVTGTGSVIFSGNVSALFTLTPGTSSTVKYDLNGAQTCRTATYNNLTLAGTGIKTVTMSCIVNNILQIDSTATLNAALSYGAAAGLKYNTTQARTTSTFEWPATFSGTGGVTISNTGIITLNAAKIFGNSSELIITANAQLNTGNFSIDFGGDFINSGTFTAGSSPINISGTAATHNIAGFTTTGTVTLTKTAGTATFTGNISAGPLTLNGTAGSLSCGTGNTHTFSKFTRGPGTLLGGSSTINITDSAFLSTGSFTAETSTVRWISNEAAQDISSVTYYNVEFGGSSVKTTYTFTTINNNFLMSGTASTTASANLTVGGNFTIGNGNTYNTAAFNLAVAGTTTIGGGSNGNLNINDATPILSFGDLVLSAGGTLINDVNAPYTINGNFTNNGNYNSGSGNITFTGTSKSFEGGTQTTFTKMVISGTYTLNSNINDVGTISGAGTLTMGSTGTLVINSSTNPTVSNFITTTTGNTVSYGFAGAQSILAKSYDNLTCANSGLKTFLGNTTVLGNFNLTGTADIDGSTFTHTFKGNITANSGVSGITLTSSKIILDGNSTQTITVARTIGLRPAKLFTANGEKIFNSAVVMVITDSLNITSGSIINLTGISSINIAGKLTGTGTFKFGSCASPSTAQATFSYAGNTSVLNFETLFNQLGQITINPGVGNSVTFQNDLTLSTTLTLTSGIALFNGTLSLDGGTPITNNGGKLNFATTGSLTFGNCVTTGTAYTIPNDIFSSTPTIKNLTINRTNGITLGNQMISLSDVLTFSAGNLATNNNLTLLSTATNTARVAPITNGSVVSGDVVVNRFIPGGASKRKWRLLSSPINVSGSIALSQFIDDILVTAPAASGGGFDVSPNNAASIRTYTESTSGASSLGWTNPTNTTNTVATGTGMEVFVRGTRGLANPYLNWTTPDNVTIDFIGALNTGSVTKTLTYTPSVGGATTADGFNLVGNPYASPINFDTTSNWTKTNIENKFWCYNPNTTNYGIYDAVAHTGTNGITRYIASGQAFFVRATSASAPSITFTENVKCRQIGNSYFKPNKNPPAFPMLRMTLIDDSADFDEALILIDSVNGTLQATDDRDAAKFFNDALNIYTVTANKSNLAFNAINIPSASDTINVSVWSYDSTNISTKHHKISFSEFESIDPTIHLYLLDQYLNVVTNIRSTDEYDFMITTDVNSYGNDRFKIILNNTNTSLPTTFKKQNIVLYPNPANEKLYLQSLDFSTSTINYIIYDLMGREIMKGNSSLENSISEINIDTLEKGNYLIRVSDNMQTNTMKFVKR